MDSGDDDPNLTTDARPISSPKNSRLTHSRHDDVVPAGTTPRVHAGRDAKRYHMGHKQRGVALVFNHEHFDAMRQRTGTDKDCKAIKQRLGDLRFDVRVHQDLKYDALRDVLAKVAAEDHSERDCLVVVVMTHGEQGGLLFTKDQMYEASELWRRFAGNRCPSLIGKPKLFFLQACRGEGLDGGTRVVCDSVDSSTSGYTIPNEADILVAYSTVDGYYSWRNPREGSWFIQSLCEELRGYQGTEDLLTVLTAVCRRVALTYQSCVPGDYKMDRKMQVPAFTSMLTRAVYF